MDSGISSMRLIHENGELIRLKEACRLFFDGQLSPSSLRAEAKKGNLIIIRIANKDFVTKSALMDMLEKCRKPASSVAPPSEKDRKYPLRSNGSDGNIALAAARASLEAARKGISKGR